MAENPTLASGQSYGSTAIAKNGSQTNKKPTTGVVASSLCDATTLFATTYFHTLVPNSMVSHVKDEVESPTCDFGTVTPPFNVLPATGLELLTKDLSPGLAQAFTLTSSATAAATWGGLADFALQTPGSIGSATPTYVTPTTASMQAAVPR